MPNKTIETSTEIYDLEISVNDSIIGNRKIVKINDQSFTFGSSSEIKELGTFLISAADD